MSRTTRDWVWSLPDLPPSPRLLLLALAEHVHHGVTCFPGQARLAAMCCVSDRQVRNLLQELQGRGLISVEHRPGQGGGRKSNVYRLEMGNRQPVSACLDEQPEPRFRNSVSGCQEALGTPAQGNQNPASAFQGGQPEPHFRNSVSERPEATGNLAQGNRKPGAGNRNSISAEPEERTGRKELRDTPPYPPKGGNFTRGQSDSASSPRTEPDKPSPTTPVVQPRNVIALEVAAEEEGSHPASAATKGNGPVPPQSTGTPLGPQGSRRRTNTRRGKRDGTDLRLVEKDYTVGATRDEDLPDWARGWRDRARVAE